jgi:hypothetical protein
MVRYSLWFLIETIRVSSLISAVWPCTFREMTQQSFHGVVRIYDILPLTHYSLNCSYDFLTYEESCPKFMTVIPISIACWFSIALSREVSYIAAKFNLQAYSPNCSATVFTELDRFLLHFMLPISHRFLVAWIVPKGTSKTEAVTFRSMVIFTVSSYT